MNKVVDIVKRLDLFGQQPVFHVRGKDAHQSILGAFVSMITIGLTLIFFVHKFNTVI